MHGKEYRVEYTSLDQIPAWFWALVLGITLFYMICYWRIFVKAGQPGWASLIPIYNIIVWLRIIGKPWWWLFLLLIPFVNIYYGIWSVNMLSKSFGKDVGFTLGLLFLGFIFLPILAFSGIQYQGPYGDPAAFAAWQGKNKFDFENRQ